MQTDKINGRNARELAAEIAKIVGGSVHFNSYGYVLTFDAADADQLELTAAHAMHYWHSVKNRAKSEAAHAVRRKINEVRMRTFAAV